MKPISDFFKADADNIGNTMNSHGETAGFRVPEYQRTYHWSEGNIKRLLEDCLNGFYNLTQSERESFTFLGTIILVKEKSEPSFDGTSLSIIDGQQRLTTLILLCCVLKEQLLSRRGDVRNLQEPTVSWVECAIDSVRDRLFKCVCGQLTRDGIVHMFPRIVRFDADNRAYSPSEAKYHSVVARFLMKFSDLYSQSDTEFILGQLESDSEEERFFKNYEYIKEQVELGIYKSEDALDTRCQSDLDHTQVDYQDFQNAGLRDLFESLDTVPGQAESDFAIGNIVSTPDSSGLIRIMLFSHYLLKSVILTRVVTSDENYAFDIFDSLNTTGEPLTAIQTFKPRVISFERENTGYSGSESERQFERIEGNLNYPDTDKLQTATKELLVTFALYLNGEKLPLSLAAQRKYLRTNFGNAPNSDLKRRIVKSLADIAEFRQTYWNRDSIRTLDSIHPNDTSDWLKLCCTFISDMKTSLAIPIMARYWVQYQQGGAEDNFLDAVKALTAFLVLRRARTGTTGRIDSDFRRTMKRLSISVNGSNSLLGLDELKSTLRKYLSAPRIEVKDKETWVSQVSEVPLADQSQPLCRFLLFAAANNAIPDPQNQGLLIRDDVIPGDHLAFLNFRTWQSDKYATVEHVAPESNSAGGWDQGVYMRPNTRHMIGNIVLLPQKENSSIGDAPWTKKKIFYRALVAQTNEERINLIDQAEAQGSIFKKQIKDLLDKQDCLHMLAPIATLEDWSAYIIRKRTKNILELAWDVIAPWLSY